MSRRIVIEEPCEHGKIDPHEIPDSYKQWLTGDDCPGGSRTVLEGIPDEWVQRGVDLVEHDLDQPNFEMGVAMETEAFVRAVLVAAVFGETP